MKERFTLKVKCPKCDSQRITNVFKGSPIGKRIECFICGSKFTINETNIVRRKVK